MATLQIDQATSQATFTVKKLGLITINGTISDFSGGINFDPADLKSSSFDVNLKVATIDTGGEKRDEHLKTPDFFAVETYPKISFQSNSIEKTGQQFLAKGQLTIRNKTKEVSLPFTYESGTFKGTFSLNRLDYNLGKKFPTFFIGKNIDIAITCSVR